MGLESRAKSAYPHDHSQQRPILLPVGRKKEICILMDITYACIIIAVP